MPTTQFISPAVSLQERDQSFISQGVSDIGGAIVGLFERGPANVPITVSSQDEFEQIFGGTDTGYYSSYAARYYLKNASQLTVVRVLDGTAENASMSITSSVENANVFDIEPITDGASANDLFEIIVTTGSNTFNIDVVAWGTADLRNPTYLETFRNLSMSGSSSEFVSRIIGDEKKVADNTNDVVYVDGEYPNNSSYIRVRNVSGSNLPAPGTYRFFTTGSTVPSYASTGSNGTLDTDNPAFATELSGASNVMGMDFTVSSSTSHYQKYIDALDLLGNADEYDINLLATPGLIQSLGGAVDDVITQGKNICEDRGDCMYVFTAAHMTLSRTPSSVTSQVSGYDTNYAAAYSGWVKVNDSTKGKNVYVPPCAIIPTVYAFTDRVQDPWFAPAGLNRGAIPEALSTYIKYTKAQRDTLYEGRVNPIASFPNEGVVVWGQKTLQQRQSALDRINVRRLLIALKKFFATTARFIVFEPNIQATRNRFLNIVNPYMESVQQRRGLVAFRVVMDETLNTSDVIDRNILRGKVFIQPTRAAEYIDIPFNITPTGAEFEE